MQVCFDVFHIPQRTTYSKVRQAIFLEKGGVHFFAFTHGFQPGPWSRQVTIVLGHNFVFILSTNTRTQSSIVSDT